MGLGLEGHFGGGTLEMWNELLLANGQFTVRSFYRLLETKMILILTLRGSTPNAAPTILSRLTF